MAGQSRQYDIVLLGASGYTGKYTAERLVQQAPTNLRWAVAGRSAAKLEAVIEGIKSINPDRTPPDIEVCGLDSKELSALASKATVIINAVGPYAVYGEPVVRACVQQGTHYLDTTGEVAWVKKMIEKYDGQAKSSKAIIMPQTGVESAMPDLMALKLVETVEQEFGAKTGSVMAAVKLKTVPSGGTLATIMAYIANHSLAEIAAAQNPFCLVPASYRQPHDRSLWQRIFGLRRDPHLGLLTTAFFSGTNAPIVHRSGMLLGYGPRFRYRELAPAGDPVRGVAIHWAFTLLPILLFLAPVRWLASKLLYRPGTGPSRQSADRDRVEYRTVATADVDPGKEPGRVAAVSSFEGSMYDLSGLYLAAAALTILEGNCFATKAGGGFLTPATLGQGFVNRAKEAGVRLETAVMGDDLPRFK